jgi:hypothetical protein
MSKSIAKSSAEPFAPPLSRIPQVLAMIGIPPAVLRQWWSLDAIAPKRFRHVANKHTYLREHRSSLPVDRNQGRRAHGFR